MGSRCLNLGIEKLRTGAVKSYRQNSMNYLTRPQEIKQAIENYTQAKTLWLDTEVADYRSKTPQLSLIQLLDHSTDLTGQTVTILDVLDYPDLVESFIAKIMVNASIQKVMHNASYDCQFLGKRKAKNITCTLQMVQSFPYYLVPLPNYQLKTLAETLCCFPPIDKSAQESDWRQRPLTQQQLIYAKMDVVYLAQIHHRLLQLSQLVSPNPQTENLPELALRYRHIEHNWKILDTEVKHLKERIKKAMESQNIADINGFKLTQQQRNNKTVNLNELAKVIYTSGITIDTSIKLTQDLQKKLAAVIEDLPIQEDIDTISQLRISNVDDDDLPF